MKRQFLVTIRIDAEKSEEAEYFFNEPFDDSGPVLDTYTLTDENHEVIEWEEIPQENLD